MEICIYQGKEICSFNLKDGCGIYQQEKVIELKRAAAKGELICAECRKRVYLAAGLIREPYFAHYDAKECQYASTVESEETRLAKRLIYHMLKRSFSEDQISVRHRLEDGTYTAFFVHISQGKELSIDYRLVQLPIKQLDQRVEYLNQHQICSLFILSDRQNKDQNQLNWYQEYLQGMIGYCIFLCLSDQMLLLKRSFHYQNQNYHINRVFEHRIPIKEALVDEQGRIVCDFVNDCEQKEQEMKQQILELIQAEEKEQQRQQEYRMQQMQKEILKEQERLRSILKKIAERINVNELTLPNGIRKDVLIHCMDMIRGGEIELISAKYLEYLLSLEFVV